MRAIPCAIMRGGTSKGVYFLWEDLPAEEEARNALILRLMGGDARQINGLGGGDMLTAKVALVARSKEAGVDLDYRFVQVVPGENRVDTGPTCGNVLAGVGIFALDCGLVTAGDGMTRVAVRDVNTGARVELAMPTPEGRVVYDGECTVDNVPGGGTPVMVYFEEFAGGKTGALFPTGRVAEEVAGVRVTCVDAAMPCVIAEAQAMGVRGDESAAELQREAGVFARMEVVRREAGRMMGMGEVAARVIPKFILVCAPRAEGAICARYFTPLSAHAAFAVSGGIALAAALMTPGTVARECARTPAPDAAGEFAVKVEHPAGELTVLLRLAAGVPVRAGVARSARLIMRGRVLAPPCRG